MDPVHTIQTENTTHVALEATLGMQDARALHEKLGTILTTSKSVLIEGSRVERIDAACMQALVGFTRAACDRGLTLTWRSPSPVLQQAIRVLGLESILEMTS